MSENTKIDISSASLHMIAMTLMLCDHLWAILLPSQEWLTCIGRISFPIFAFLVAEGYRRTSNLKHYIMRIFICAIISEIPFNLMISGGIFYPYHQNVIWTFLISLLVIRLIETVYSHYKRNLSELITVVIVLLSFIIGFLTMVDYYGAGVLTVLMFYFFQDETRRKKKWRNWLYQLFFMCILNIEILGGYYYVINIFGTEWEIAQQGFALFALIPIWFYKGRQGIHDKKFQYFCYIFYPSHMLILYIIAICIT